MNWCTMGEHQRCLISLSASRTEIEGSLVSAPFKPTYLRCKTCQTLKLNYPSTYECVVLAKTKTTNSSILFSISTFCYWFIECICGMQHRWQASKIKAIHHLLGSSAVREVGYVTSPFWLTNDMSFSNNGYIWSDVRWSSAAAGKKAHETSFNSIELVPITLTNVILNTYFAGVFFCVCIIARAQRPFRTQFDI